MTTTTASGERQKLKHVIVVPHRGARIRVRAINDVSPAPRAAALPATRGASGVS